MKGVETFFAFLVKSRYSHIVCYTSLRCITPRTGYFTTNLAEHIVGRFVPIKNNNNCFKFTMNTSDQVNLLTSIVALAAFLLSLYNFYVDRRDKSTNLVVRLSVGDMNLEKGKEKILGRAFLIEVINAGHINVFISEVFVLLGKRKVYLEARNIEKENFKTSVSPKENVVFWVSMPSKDFAAKEQLVGKTKVRAFARDTLGKLYRSKELILNQHDFVD